MATEIKSDQIKSEKLVAIPSANKPTSPAEGMVFRADGTGDSAKGLYEYKNSKWVSLDQSLDSMESVSLITSGDTSALSFDAALNSTSTAAGHKNAVPHEVSTGALDGTFTVPTTGSDALFTDRNAHLVFRYASSGTASCKNDYVGITIDIPAAFRGQNLVAEFQYRTQEGTSTDSSSNNDFQLSVWDKTNGKSITSTDTSAKTAGTAIAVSSKTGLTVGDKIWLESGGNAVGHSDNTITQSYITSISGTADEITISADWTPASTAGSRLVTKFLSDYDIGLPEADSDTNKDGSTYKLAFKTEATTAQVNLYWQNKSTTANSLELFFDGILVSANKFLQASSQLKTEAYGSVMSTAFWGSSTALSRQWDKALLVPKIGSPPIDDSKFITISDITGPGTHGTVTAITAKQPIELAVTVVGQLGSTNYLNIYDQDGNSVGEYQNASGTMWGQVNATVGLAKNNYLFFYKETSTNANGNVQIVAKAQTSDVILLESQDQIFTNWVDYTPSFPTANWAAGGANIVNHCRWRRVGSNMEIDVSFTMSTGTMSTAQPLFPLPSGYSIRSDVIAVNNFTEGFVARITSTDSLIKDGRTTLMAYVAGNSTQLSMIFRAASGTTLTYDPISNIFAAGDTAAGTFSVPIQGWNSNFNPLMSMPLVDFGTFENSYSARISSTGTITSQSGNFLASAAPGTTGIYTITFTSGFFDVAPSITATAEVSNHSIIAVDSITTSGASFEINNASGTKENRAFNITVSRQGSDYRQPPKPTAAVIKPAVAILSDEKAYNVAGGNNTTGSWLKRIINTVRGESWFVTGSFDGVGGTNTTFTLEAGTYKLQSSFGFYRTGQTQMILYDETNSTYPAFGIFSQNQTSWSTSGAVDISMKGTFTITTSTEFSLKYRSPDAYTNGLGLNNSHDSAVNSCYGQVMIEKLK